MFWIFQIFWVWVVSVAIIFVNSALIKDPMSRARLGAADYVGWAIALLGWVIQMIADIHKV